MSTTLRAYLPSGDPRHLYSMNDDELGGRLSISLTDMSSYGWVEVGEAQATFRLFPLAAVASVQITALEKQREQIKVRSLREMQKITDQIQNLLALPNEVV